MKILGISKFRVQNISKQFLKDGKSPHEKRGGDHRSGKFTEIRESLKRFFTQLHFVESHYTRGKTLRFYLPSDCSVHKLCKMYNQRVQNDKIVKYSYFLKFFNFNYNISFKSPATDACSTCISLRSKIKNMPQGRGKIEVMAQLAVHKMKSKFFYEMLKKKEEPNVLKLSFDCQKNLPLPKVPDQAAYYSRQLYLYNFTICVGDSRSVQNKESVFMYTWCEHQRLKGSNEIASILFHHLQKSDLTNTQEIKLFCDGCPGQNKNLTVVGMLSKWLSDTQSGVKKITMVFPVVGHSFLPADRVFGRIEKKIKKVDTLITPQDYLDIFSEFGTVCKVTEDIAVEDWKTEVSSVFKVTGGLHFRFAQSKRIIIEKNNNRLIFVQGHEHYRSALTSAAPKSILKRGKTLSMMKPRRLPYSVNAKPEKLADVDKLLQKHFGVDWRGIESLKFYRDILDGNGDASEEENENDEENYYFEENEDLRI